MGLSINGVSSEGLKKKLNNSSLRNIAFNGKIVYKKNEKLPFGFEQDAGYFVGENSRGNQQQDLTEACRISDDYVVFIQEPLVSSGDFIAPQVFSYDESENPVFTVAPISSNMPEISGRIMKSVIGMGNNQFIIKTNFGGENLDLWTFDPITSQLNTAQIPFNPVSPSATEKLCKIDNDNFIHGYTVTVTGGFRDFNYVYYSRLDSNSPFSAVSSASFNTPFFEIASLSKLSGDKIAVIMTKFPSEGSGGIVRVTEATPTGFSELPSFDFDLGSFIIDNAPAGNLSDVAVSYLAYYKDNQVAITYRFQAVNSADDRNYLNFLYLTNSGLKMGSAQTKLIADNNSNPERGQPATAYIAGFDSKDKLLLINYRNLQTVSIIY